MTEKTPRALPCFSPSNAGVSVSAEPPVARQQLLARTLLSAAFSSVLVDLPMPAGWLPNGVSGVTVFQFVGPETIDLAVKYPVLIGNLLLLCALAAFLLAPGLIRLGERSNRMVISVVAAFPLLVWVAVPLRLSVENWAASGGIFFFQIAVSVAPLAIFLAPRAGQTKAIALMRSRSLFWFLVIAMSMYSGLLLAVTAINVLDIVTKPQRDMGGFDGRAVMLLFGTLAGAVLGPVLGGIVGSRLCARHRYS